MRIRRTTGHAAPAARRRAAGNGPRRARALAGSADPHDLRVLLQELEIHQVELETQNEELRRVQLALAEARDRYSDLYHHAPVGYLTIDRQGRILEMNLTAAAMLGEPPETLADASLAQFLRPDTGDGDRLHVVLRRLFASGETQVCDLRFIQHDGTTFWGRLESAVRRGQTQAPETCWSILSDVTETRRWEVSRRRSERLASVGTLAAGIAHEVNNPLGMIMLEADLALQALDAAGGRRNAADALRRIKDLVERAGTIVRKVLRFSGEGAAARTREPIAAILRQARDLVAVQARQRGITVRLDCAGDLPLVEMNRIEIEQVFVNLLTNAFQASPRGAVVKVSAASRAGGVAVRVRDPGRGMDRDEVKRIFDPFYTTRQRKGGTGLGLSITYGIVEDHGGTLDVESRPGEGTCMTVTFPLAEGAAHDGRAED